MHGFFQRVGSCRAGCELFFLAILQFGLLGATWAFDAAERPDAWFSPCSDGAGAWFRSGFEGALRIKSDSVGRRATFAGRGEALSCARTQAVQGASHARLGRALIEFEGGGEEARGAEIARANPELGGHVLRFWLVSPNVLGVSGTPVKGRVQMSVYGNRNVGELAVSVRMYLHSDFNIVRSFPGTFDWLTVSEWWNNAGWTDEGFPFRITVNLVKERAGPNGALFFQVKAQALDGRTRRWMAPVWKATNTDFVVPVGRWLNLDYGLVEGDSSSGRFVLAATVEGGKKEVIFDISNFTHHPDDRNPNGISEFNPMKLYTSSKLIDHVREHGGTIQIMWDDFEIATCTGCAMRFFERKEAGR